VLAEASNLLFELELKGPPRLKLGADGFLIPSGTQV
jgi:hypothetical protein